MPRIAYKIGVLLKERMCSQREHILSFKSSPCGKEAIHFMYMPLYFNVFLMHFKRMGNVSNDRYAYGQVLSCTLASSQHSYDSV